MEGEVIHFHNGRIYTDEGIKDSMTINSGTGKIISIGDHPEASHKVDLQGKLVLPDSHIHVHSFGAMLNSLQVRGVESIKGLQEKLSEFAANRAKKGIPKESWIVGFGWDQDMMKDSRYPSRHDLDAAVPDSPVMLLRGCCHICVVNSEALKVLGIDENTPNPEGGAIDRDATGQPTGILRELASKLAREQSKGDRATAKRETEESLRYCLSKGLTAVHTNDEEAWEIYQELQAEGKMNIRVYLTPYHAEIHKPTTPKPKQCEGLLQAHRVKILADGSLGAETAALRSTYLGNENKGILLYPPSTIASMVKDIHDLGYRLEVHAIGDYAAEVVLDAFEAAGVTAKDRPLLTHCQILAPDLFERMVKLGVIGNIQPQFVLTDSLWVEKRLRPEMLPYCYAWKTMQDRGIVLAGGSDAPIEEPNPLLGIHAAIFRGAEGKPWRGEESLSFKEALHMYTAGCAYAAYEEDRLGKIAPGYCADFVVVDKDVDLDPTQLPSSTILQVWVNGVKKL